MPKTKRSQGGGNASWNKEKHASRLSRKLNKEGKEKSNLSIHHDAGDEEKNSPIKKAKKRYERSIHLSHDNDEKREQSKLRLHISKADREVQRLRSRLEAWDELEEQRNYKTLQRNNEEQRKRQSEEHQEGTIKKKKKKGRLGPETWKLRGAARPASEVCEFDTRFVDPHLKNHKEAQEKAKRIVNAFQLYKGHFGQEPNGESEISELLCQVNRSFLSVLMQLSLLNIEAKKFKCARQTLLEIIELEGTRTHTPITNARCRLMRLNLEANRPDSARKLWQRLPKNYASVWIRFSAALLEYVSWNILKEDGSTKESAEDFLLNAIRANVFCAYYIAFHKTFDKVFEYTEDLEDEENGSLLQAIEYCNSEQLGNWDGTEGAVEWIRGVILQSLRSVPKATVSRNKDDFDWSSRLDEAVKAEETKMHKTDGGGKEEIANNNEKSDLLMFAGMFRTGIDMLSDSGAFMNNIM